MGKLPRTGLRRWFQVRKYEKLQLQLGQLAKAISTVSEALSLEPTSINKDGTIQRFEYTFELSWKALKRYFKINNNLEIFNVKDIFREAGKQGLIEKVEKWFEYLEARNLTSHTYDENIAEKVYTKAKEFEKDAHFLCQQLKKIIK